MWYPRRCLRSQHVKARYQIGGSKQILPTFECHGNVKCEVEVQRAMQSFVALETAVEYECYGGDYIHEII
jgi:hypothetical protein